MRGRLFALCVGLIACSRAQDAVLPAREPVHGEVLQLAYAGCLRVEHAEHKHCELSSERRLSCWLSSTSTPLVVQSEHGPIAPVRSERSLDGTRFELHVPAGVQQLTLSAGTNTWRLTLRDTQDVGVLAEARALRQRGQLAAARDQLQASLPQLSAELQRRARAEIARIALQEGDYAAAVSGLSQTFDTAIERGQISEAFSDGTALAFVLSTNLRHFEAARAVLTRLETLSARDDEGRAFLPHCRGVLALETGDLRLGLREHELLAREQEAWSLSLLGQRDAAIAAQQAIAESFDSGDPCQRADRYESVVWYSILANLDAAARTERRSRLCRACGA